MKKSDTLICIGQFLGAHGVKGLVKIASFTENAEDIVAYGSPTDSTGKRSFDFELKSWNNTHFIGTVEGINTREEAEALKGIKLFVPRARLPKTPPGQYYHADLIGLEARLADGSVYGKVLSVQNYGAGDIIEVEGPKGRELLPFSNAVVPDVFVDEGYLVLDLPEMIEGDHEGA